VGRVADKINIKNVIHNFVNNINRTPPCLAGAIHPSSGGEFTTCFNCFLRLGSQADNTQLPACQLFSGQMELVTS